MKPLQWIRNLSINKRQKIIDNAWYGIESKYAMHRDNLRDICKMCAPILLLERELRKEVGKK